MEPLTIRKAGLRPRLSGRWRHRAIRSASKGYSPNLPFDFVAATARLIADLNRDQTGGLIASTITRPETARLVICETRNKLYLY
jgi:hypothetical protein